MNFSNRKIKVIKRDTLSDLDRRRIAIPPDARKMLLDRKAILIREVNKIERELQAI